MSSDKKVTNPALLTRRELDWLLGKTEGISTSFEYKIKSSLKKKVRAFVEIELPLLLKNGLFPALDGLIYPTSEGRLEEGSSPNGDLSLGKAKVPGPNPGQGLPIFQKRGKNRTLTITEKAY
jgi:hypothetical protein